MLVSLAVDFHAADVATRERFHVSHGQLLSLYARMRDDGVAESALIATCNRTELYAWLPDACAGNPQDTFSRLAHLWTGTDVDAAALLDISITRISQAVPRHAIRVASGLESQVLGDGQILGQFRHAYRTALDAAATGPVLNRMFEIALRSGKRVQSNTQLSSGSNSIGAEAAALIARRNPNLENARVAIVGCGKTGERVARQLAKFGARDMVFLNRTDTRASELAQELPGRSAAIENALDEISFADVAVVATGSVVPVVLAEHLALARESSGTSLKPLLLVDLSMPRNIEASASRLPSVALIDLDDLQPQITATEETRRASIPAAEEIVEAELSDFNEWLAVATAREAIRPFREALADVCLRELQHAAGDEVAERLSKRIVAKLMARPMTAVRIAMARGEPVAELTRTMNTLFSEPVHELEIVPEHVGVGD